MIKKAALLGTAILAATAGITPAAAQFRSALDQSQATVREAKSSQQRIDDLDEATNKLLIDYRANLKQYELLERFNKTRTKEVENQQVVIQRLINDVENVESVAKGAVPLQGDMVKTLEEFVSADLPFYVTERSVRIGRLQEKLNDPGASQAERYRLILEAYQIENEYGRTMDTYTDALDGLESVEVLRIGRVALIYKTADDSVLKIYDSEAGAWTDLDKSFLGDVNYGIRMAAEQTAPELLPIPVKAPVNVAQ